MMDSSSFDINTSNWMYHDEDINKAARILKAMSHPLRLKILCVIKDSELSVLEVVDLVQSSQSNVSQHIDILRSQDILESRRDGNRILCKITNIHILELIVYMQNIFCKPYKK